MFLLAQYTERMRRMFNNGGYDEIAPCTIVVIIISCVNMVYHIDIPVQNKMKYPAVNKKGNCYGYYE